MPKRAEPLKPNPCTAAAPAEYPSTPPLCPGKPVSSRYKRVHSIPQLATSNTAKPSQNTHKLRHHEGLSKSACGSTPRNQRAKATNQAR